MEVDELEMCQILMEVIIITCNVHCGVETLWNGSGKPFDLSGICVLTIWECAKYGYL
jgi:hypothetical protein